MPNCSNPAAQCLDRPRGAPWRTCWPTLDPADLLLALPVADGRRAADRATSRTRWRSSGSTPPTCRRPTSPPPAPGRPPASRSCPARALPARCCSWAAVTARRRPADRGRRRRPRRQGRAPRRDDDRRPAPRSARRRRSSKGWRWVATRPRGGSASSEPSPAPAGAGRPRRRRTTSRHGGTRRYPGPRHHARPQPRRRPLQHQEPRLGGRPGPDRWPAAAGCGVRVWSERELQRRGLRRAAGGRRRLGHPAAPGAARPRAGGRDRRDAARRPRGQGHHLRHRWARHQAGRGHARDEDGHERRRRWSSPCWRPAATSGCRCG